MRRKLLILSLISMMSILLFTITTYADTEINNSESKSSISIWIKEKTLYLENVTVPKFEDQKLTGREMTINPVNDFKFTVKDKRDYAKSPWQVYYSLSLFQNENDEKVDSQNLTIKKGQVEEIDVNSYESYEVSAEENAPKPILKVTDTSKTTYNYIVSKNDFSLTIGGNVKSGKYEAKQTVMLASLPTSN